MWTSPLMLLVACQAPFAEDRHDLASFRIAAVAATPSATGVSLRALIWSGHGAWHPATPTARWSVTGADGVVVEAQGVRAEVEVTLPASVLLVASDAEGHDEQAVLDVSASTAPPEILSWTRAETSLTAQDAAKPIATRAAVVPDSASTTSPAGALRLTVEPADPDLTLTHWMGAGGQFAELDPHQTDWFAAEVEIDDGEVVASVPLGVGVYPLVALTLDGVGGNTWTWVDAGVDVGPHLRVDGRILPIDSSISGSGLFVGTVEAVEDLVGFRLVEVEPVSDTSAADPGCGAGEDGMLDLDLIASGGCGRDELVGRRVVLSGEAVP